MYLILNNVLDYLDVLPLSERDKLNQNVVYVLQLGVWDYRDM